MIKQIIKLWLEEKARRSEFNSAMEAYKVKERWAFVSISQDQMDILKLLGALNISLPDITNILSQHYSHNCQNCPEKTNKNPIIK